MRYDAYEIDGNNIVFYSATGQTQIFDREEELQWTAKRDQKPTS